MSNGKILLVEDNTDDVLLTKRALEKAHVANVLEIANDGIEALEYLRGEGTHEGRDAGDMPVVVLLDLKMPRMGGLEFLRIVREDERLRLLPIVVLTSSKEEQDVIESYSLGANSYIQKPVDFDQFVKAIQTLGLYWLILNVNPREARSS
ncbi:MAG: response regulator [Promethearchaeota archaeon]